jgi:hypothetical protein
MSEPSKESHIGNLSHAVKQLCNRLEQGKKSSNKKISAFCEVVLDEFMYIKGSDEILSTTTWAIVNEWSEDIGKNVSELAEGDNE